MESKLKIPKKSEIPFKKDTEVYVIAIKSEFGEFLRISIYNSDKNLETFGGLELNIAREIIEREMAKFR